MTPTPERVGRFEVRGTIGRGAFGVVHRAWDPAHGREVALKVLTQLGERPTARFAREAEALARLDHPGIVRLLEAGHDRGRPFLVMDLVTGRSLEALVRAEGPLRPARAAAVALEVARAVAHAHERGVLHRDLKPQNVLLDAAGRARVVDLGLVHLAGTGAERLTLSGTALGTPGFMAPEQASGKHVGPAADVYGVGGILYFLLAGRAPFVGDTAEVMVALHRGAPEPPSRHAPWAGVPAGLDALVLRCLARDPADRPASAADLVAALEGLGRDAAGPPPGRRARAAAVAGAAGVVIVFAVPTLAAARALRPPAAPTPPPVTPPPVAPAPTPPPGDPAPVAPPPVVAPAAAAAEAVRATLATVAERAQRRAPHAELAEALEAALAAAGGDDALALEVRLARARLDLRRGRLPDGLARAQALIASAGAGAGAAGAAAALEARWLEGQAMSRLGLREGAQARWRALAADDPDGAWGLLAAAAADLDWADRPGLLRSLEASQRAAALAPTVASIRRYELEALLALGRVGPAAPVAASAAALAPDDVDVLFEVGLAHYMASRHAASFEAFDAAVRLAEPTPAHGAVFWRGLSHRALRRLDAARADLDRAVAASPDSVRYLLLRGAVLDELGEPDLAAADWRRAAALDRPALGRWARQHRLPPPVLARIEAATRDAR